jgi:glycosyltransferase involved in cell wall biosynthesis
MKILQVIPYFNPKKGGDVAVAYQISKYLSQMGHDVTIITSNHEFDNNYAKSLQNVNVIPFDCNIYFNKLIITPDMKKWLKNELKAFDILHLHNFRTYQNGIIRYYAKKYEIPYILQAHGSLPRIIEKKGLKYLFDIFFGYKILRDASKVIAVSNIEVNQYLEMGVSKEKIVVIPNCIDVDSFNDLPEKGTFKKKYGISEKYIILFLGRLHEIKGIDFLLESYAELRKEMDDVVLVLAGSDDGYKAKAEILINKLNLTNEVRFIGYVGGVDKLAAYVDANVLVYPSIFEIFGLVPFEAIMCGTPVIVTDDCGCGELMRKANCGYLVKYGDVNDVEDRMKWVIKNPKEGRRLIDAGRKYIEENLAWNNAIRQVEEIYESCIHNI